MISHKQNQMSYKEHSLFIPILSMPKLLMNITWSCYLLVTLFWNSNDNWNTLAMVSLSIKYSISLRFLLNYSRYYSATSYFYLEIAISMADLTLNP